MPSNTTLQFPNSLSGAPRQTSAMLYSTKCAIEFDNCFVNKNSSRAKTGPALLICTLPLKDERAQCWIDVITVRLFVHACTNALNTFAICNCPSSFAFVLPVLPSLLSPFPFLPLNIFPFTKCSSNCCRPLTRTFLLRPDLMAQWRILKRSPCRSPCCACARMCCEVWFWLLFRRFFEGSLKHTSFALEINYYHFSSEGGTISRSWN